MLRLSILLLSLTGLFYLTSCGDVQATPSSADAVGTNLPGGSLGAVPASDTDRLQLQASVDQLSVRSVPDTGGELLARIGVGESVTYLGEETDFKDKITLRGKPRYASWKKVIYTDTNGKSTTGWAYGGGLINPGTLYRQLDAHTYVRTVDAMSSEEISLLLAFDVPEDLYYDGEIHYIKRDNAYLPHGKFSVSASQELPDLPDYIGPAHFEVSGTYTHGRKNGIFELQYQMYESASVFTMLFEQDACDWFSVIADAEGESYSIRDDHPATCTLKYMGEKMKQKY